MNVLPILIISAVPIGSAFFGLAKLYTYLSERNARRCYASYHRWVKRGHI